MHVSEIAHGFIKTPGQVLHEGDEVETKVLEVNRRKKQIKLSIKAVLPEPEEKPVEKKVNKKGRSRKGKTEIEEGIIETEPREPDPTVMEMAWREALVRAENKTGKKEKPAKVSHAREQEDILNRTLEQRITTG